MVDPLSYFLFQPVLHAWCNKGCGMCYPVCGMMHIKEPLLLIGKSSLCCSSRVPLSLSEWSFTICLTPYNQGAGRSSVDSVPAFEAVGRRIDPSQWTQLQFGLFSVPTSGPQLVYQSPWYVLFCLWKSAYKRSLAAYRKE